MRRQFLIPFCVVTAVLAALLIWLVAHKAPGASQVTEAQALTTNAPVKHNTVQQNVAIKQTNVTANSTIQNKTWNELTVDEKNKAIRKMLEAQNKPIEVWGKVVDQDDAPLSGVKVQAEIGHFVWPPEQYPNGVSSNLELITDANGQFHIQDNSATSVGVTLQKNGYEQESLKGNGYALGSGGGSQANPIILKMWSTNTHQKLITGGNHFDIVPDGRPYFINLTDGTISESEAGDLKVWIQYTNQVVRGQLYDWSAGIEVINGGLQKTNTDEMFIAPIDGYAPSFQLKGQIKGGQRGNIGELQFYLKLKDGNEYGRMTIEMIAPFNNQTPGLIRLSYALNPSGSRILR
jgi:hypothetical protein